MDWTTLNQSFNLTVHTISLDGISDYDLIKNYCNDLNSIILSGILFLTFIVILKILLSLIPDLKNKYIKFFKETFLSMNETVFIIFLFYLSGFALTKLDLISEEFILRLKIIIFPLLLIAFFLIIWVINKKLEKIKKKK